MANYDYNLTGAPSASEVNAGMLIDSVKVFNKENDALQGGLWNLRNQTLWSQNVVTQSASTLWDSGSIAKPRSIVYDWYTARSGSVHGPSFYGSVGPDDMRVHSSTFYDGSYGYPTVWFFQVEPADDQKFRCYRNGELIVVSRSFSPSGTPDTVGGGGLSVYWDSTGAHEPGEYWAIVAPNSGSFRYGNETRTSGTNEKSMMIVSGSVPGNNGDITVVSMSCSQSFDVGSSYPMYNAELRYYGKQKNPGTDVGKDPIDIRQTDVIVKLFNKTASGFNLLAERTDQYGTSYSLKSISGQIPTTGLTDNEMMVEVQAIVRNVTGDPNIQRDYGEVHLDDFKLVIEKPKVELVPDGILAISNENKYVKVTSADGLEIKGGSGEFLDIDIGSDLSIGNKATITGSLYVGDNIGLNVDSPLARVHISGSQESENLLLIESASGGTAVLHVSSSGKVFTGADLDVGGTLTKGAGSFKITHPDPDFTGSLYHSFVESPTAGDNLYRWRCTLYSGSNVLDLPDYYRYLNKDDMVWISPVGHFGRAYGEVNKLQTQINIQVDTSGEYNILCVGTRKDEFAISSWDGVERE